MPWLLDVGQNPHSNFEYGFCPTSDNQDGRQNARHLSTSAVVVTLAQLLLIRFLNHAFPHSETCLFLVKLFVTTTADIDRWRPFGRPSWLSDVG